MFLVAFWMPFGTRDVSGFHFGEFLNFNDFGQFRFARPDVCLPSPTATWKMLVGTLTFLLGVGLQTAPKGKEAIECTESKPTGAPPLVRQECDDKWEITILKKAHGVMPRRAEPSMRSAFWQPTLDQL